MPAPSRVEVWTHELISAGSLSSSTRQGAGGKGASPRTHESGPPAQSPQFGTSGPAPATWLQIAVTVPPRNVSHTLAAPARPLCEQRPGFPRYTQSSRSGPQQCGPVLSSKSRPLRRAWSLLGLPDYLNRARACPSWRLRNQRPAAMPGRRLATIVSCFSERVFRRSFSGSRKARADNDGSVNGCHGRCWPALRRKTGCIIALCARNPLHPMHHGPPRGRVPPWPGFSHKVSLCYGREDAPATPAILLRLNSRVGARGTRALNACAARSP